MFSDGRKYDLHSGGPGGADRFFACIIIYYIFFRVIVFGNLEKTVNGGIL